MGREKRGSDALKSPIAWQREWGFTIHYCSPDTWTYREKKQRSLEEVSSSDCNLISWAPSFMPASCYTPMPISEYDKLKLFMFHFVIKMSAPSIEDDCTEHAQSEYNERIGRAFILLAVFWPCFFYWTWVHWNEGRREEVIKVIIFRFPSFMSFKNLCFNIKNYLGMCVCWHWSKTRVHDGKILVNTMLLYKHRVFKIL